MNEDIELSVNESGIDDEAGQSTKKASQTAVSSQSAIPSQTANKSKVEQNKGNKDTNNNPQHDSNNDRPKGKGKGKKRRYVIPKKKHKKQKKYEFSTSDSSASSTLSSSDNSGSDSDHESAENRKQSYAMFDPLEHEKEFTLETNLQDFLSKYFSKFLDEATMSKVLEGCPFPSCEALQVPKLDEEWKDILEGDKRNVPMLKTDKNLSRIQGALMRSIAPLAQFWTTLDKAAKNRIQNKEVDLNETIKLIERTVICLGQVNVQLNYFRRLPIIAKVLGDTKKATEMLAKNADILDGRRNLLGPKFHKVLKKKIKKRESNKELTKAFKPVQKVSFRPFRGGPSTSQGVGGRGYTSPNPPPTRGSYTRGTRGYTPRYRGRYVSFAWKNNVRFPKVTGGSGSTKQSAQSNTSSQSSTKNGPRISLCESTSKTGNSENGFFEAKPQSPTPSSRGKVTILFTQLGKDNARSDDFAKPERDENRLDSKTSTGVSNCEPKIQSGKFSKK